MSGPAEEPVVVVELVLSLPIDEASLFLKDIMVHYLDSLTACTIRTTDPAREPNTQSGTPSTGLLEEESHLTDASGTSPTHHAWHAVEGYFRPVPGEL